MRRNPIALLGVALAAWLVASPSVLAKELVFGANLRSNHGIAAQSLMPFFSAVSEATGGELKFKFVGSNQVVNLRTVSNSITKRIVDAGLIVPVYQRKTYPNSNVMFDMQAFSSDTVAVTGAALETLFLNCPDCLAEWKKAGQVFLSNYAVSPFMVMCKDEIKTAKDLAGKKIRVSGANGRFAKVVNAVTVNMPPADGVQAMQRGALDCVIGAVSWLTGYGYIDVVKQVVDFPLGAIGMVGQVVLNRDAWNELSDKERGLIYSQQHLVTARGTIYGYVKESERVRKIAIEKGIKFDKVDLSDAMAQYQANEEKFIPVLGKKMGARDPESIMAAYRKVLPAWEAISSEVGSDADKFAASVKARIYDKTDASKL